MRSPIACDNWNLARAMNSLILQSSPACELQLVLYRWQCKHSLHIGLCFIACGLRAVKCEQILQAYAH
jgi:hypothetical protein